jgi:hypothetical protein
VAEVILNIQKCGNLIWLKLWQFCILCLKVR